MTNAEVDKIIDRAVDKSEQRLIKLLKKDRKESEERMQQYIGAIAEDSKYNVTAVAEQYLGLNEKVDRIEAVANATFEEVGALRIEMTENNENLKNYSQRITVLERKMR